MWSGYWPLIHTEGIKADFLKLFLAVSTISYKYVYVWNSNLIKRKAKYACSTL